MAVARQMAASFALQLKGAKHLQMPKHPLSTFFEHEHDELPIV
jgi:hypothetical protein